MAYFPLTFLAALLISHLLVLCGSDAFASDDGVDFVIGGYLEHEGGTWKSNTSPLRHPFGIDFDSRGNMYIVELEGGRVHRLDADGSLVRIAGDGSKSYRGDGGPALEATFNGMHNCVVTSDDRLLIADSWNHCVRAIDLHSGRISTIIGTGQPGYSGDGGPARNAAFNFIMCISLNHAKDTLHITDLKNRRIRDVDLDSMIVSTVAGNGEKGIPNSGARAVDAPLFDPRAAASDRLGQLFILERGGHALRMVDPNGAIHTVAGTGQKGNVDGPAKQAQFDSPKHLAVDADHRVYIADDMNASIRLYDPARDIVQTLLGNGVGDTRLRLSRPHGVCVHGKFLYVVDSGNHRIMRIPLP